MGEQELHEQIETLKLDLLQFLKICKLVKLENNSISIKFGGDFDSFLETFADIRYRYTKLRKELLERGEESSTLDIVRGMINTVVGAMEVRGRLDRKLFELEQQIRSTATQQFDLNQLPDMKKIDHDLTGTGRIRLLRLKWMAYWKKIKKKLRRCQQHVTSLWAPVAYEYGSTLFPLEKDQANLFRGETHYCKISQDIVETAIEKHIFSFQSPVYVVHCVPFRRAYCTVSYKEFKDALQEMKRDYPAESLAVYEIASAVSFFQTLAKDYAKTSANNAVWSYVLGHLVPEGLEVDPDIHWHKCTFLGMFSVSRKGFSQEHTLSLYTVSKNNLEETARSDNKITGDTLRKHLQQLVDKVNREGPSCCHFAPYRSNAIVDAFFTLLSQQG